MAGLGSGWVCVEGIKGLEGFLDTRGRRPLPRPAGGRSIGLVESDLGITGNCLPARPRRRRP